MYTKLFLAALTSCVLASGADAQISRIQNGEAQIGGFPRVLPDALPRNPTLMCPDLEVSIRIEPSRPGMEILYVSLTNIGTRPYRSTQGLQYVFLKFRQGALNEIDADFPFTNVEIGEVLEFSIEHEDSPQSYGRAEIVFSPRTQQDNLRSNDECHRGNNVVEF